MLEIVPLSPASFFVAVSQEVRWACVLEANDPAVGRCGDGAAAGEGRPANSTAGQALPDSANPTVPRCCGLGACGADGDAYHTAASATEHGPVHPAASMPAAPCMLHSTASKLWLAANPAEHCCPARCCTADQQLYCTRFSVRAHCTDRSPRGAALRGQTLVCACCRLCPSVLLLYQHACTHIQHPSQARAHWRCLQACWSLLWRLGPRYTMGLLGSLSLVSCLGCLG